MKTREDWRKWLEKNHAATDGIWLLYYKKHTAKPSVTYREAVEEALCFGWIDGKIRRINDECYIQWYTPRRRGSRWSALNVERVRKLISQGLMMPAGLEAFKIAEKNTSLIEKRTEVNLTIPDDLSDALRKNKVAMDNFMKFPPSSRKLYLQWLESSKKPETRVNRIAKIVDRSEKNLKGAIM